MPGLGLGVGLGVGAGATSEQHQPPPGTMDFSKPAESGLIILLEDI